MAMSTLQTVRSMLIGFWPVDPNKKSSIQQLLDSLGGLGYETTSSRVDGLVLYWSIQVTNAQVETADSHSQVSYHPAIFITK
jgi:hypothetical protein